MTVAEAGYGAAVRSSPDAGPRGRTRASVRRRRAVALAGMVVALGLVALGSLAIGARLLPPGVVWDALWHPDSAAVSNEAVTIVHRLRVPRTLLGLAAGVALGLAGTLMQGHTRNPLADPGLLGVTQGAGFAVAMSIFALGMTSFQGYVWFGFAGALVASVGVFALGSAGRGGPTPVTLALAGAAVSALLNALTSTILLLDQQTMDMFRFWNVGAVSGRGLGITGQLLPFLVVGTVLALANAPGLNVLALGRDVARSLGQRVLLARILGIAAITLLTGATVAACGPLAFIGLIVPHLARPLAGADYRWQLPYAGLLGAVLLVAADVAGRVVARPGELQAGIMLAIVGAPFFIMVVRRRRLVRL